MRGPGFWSVPDSFFPAEARAAGAGCLLPDGLAFRRQILRQALSRGVFRMSETDLTAVLRPGKPTDRTVRIADESVRLRVVRRIDDLHAVAALERSAAGQPGHIVPISLAVDRKLVLDARDLPLGRRPPPVVESSFFGMPPDDDGRGRDAFAVEFPGDLRIPVAEVSDEQPETGDCGGCDPEGFFR